MAHVPTASALLQMLLCSVCLSDLTIDAVLALQLKAASSATRSPPPKRAPPTIKRSPPPKRSPPLKRPSPPPPVKKSPPPPPPPTPPAAPRTFIVGADKAWNAYGTDMYQKWADTQTFWVLDTLVFHYEAPHNETLGDGSVEEEHHDVHVMANLDLYNSCNKTNSTEPGEEEDGVKPEGVRVMLNRPGWWFFVCGVASHCGPGQQRFKIYALPRPRTVVVGGLNQWKMGVNSSVIQLWANAMAPFYVGEQLVFFYPAPETFDNGTVVYQDVHRLSNPAGRSTCTFDAANDRVLANATHGSNANGFVYTIPAPGKYAFVSKAPGACAAGIAVNITAIHPQVL